MKQVLSVLLSLTALFSCAFGGLSVSAGAAEEIPSVAEVLGDYTPSLEGVSWEDIEYVHYDPTDFYAAADELEDLADSGDIQEIEALYDQLYDSLLQVSSLDTITAINTRKDVTDDYWTGEYSFCSALCSEMEDSLYQAGHAVMEGSAGEEFAAYVGPELAEEFAGYESNDANGRLADLREQEAELITQYYDVMSREDEVTYTYNGQEWTEELLYGEEGDILHDSDYDGYRAVYYGLREVLAEQAGPLYLELVENRTEQAELLGYDSYIEYRYAYYGRGYTPEDAQVLCDAVKAIAPDFYADNIYRSDLLYESDNVLPAMDAEEIVAVLGSYVSEIDGSLYDAWAYMVTHDLYDLGDGANRAGLGVTEYLGYYNTSYIFLTFEGNICYDFSTAVHEFGHFAEFYEIAPEDPILAEGSYDLFEIHSTGLELLFTEFYDDIYTDGADIARFQVLVNIMYGVVSGCIYDEFQREVYANPDMTLEEINRLFAEICAEYGVESDLDENYYWVFIPHNFEEPLYYISYATSSLAAIQIWDMAQTDFDAAVDTYMDILRKGAYDEDYFEVLSDCGLALFTEDGAVEEICRPLMDELTALAG